MNSKTQIKVNRVNMDNEIEKNYKAQLFELIKREEEINLNIMQIQKEIQKEMRKKNTDTTVPELRRKQLREEIAKYETDYKKLTLLIESDVFNNSQQYCNIKIRAKDGKSIKISSYKKPKKKRNISFFEKLIERILYYSNIKAMDKAYERIQ